MFRVSKAIAPLALVVGIAGATVFLGDASAQPPFGKAQPGKGGRPGEKKTDDKKADDKRERPGAKSDPVVDAWVKVLIEKITDPHDTVRESARGALVGVGPPAIPALQRLAEGNDPAKAVAARKLINAIQQRGPGQDRQGDRGRGFGGFGPGGRGPGGPPGMGPMGPMRPGRPMEPRDRDESNPMRPMGPGGERPAGLERVLGNLNLTEKQQKEIQEALEQQTKKIRETAEQLRRNGKIDRQEIQEVTEKLQKELLEGMKKVLNDEQFKKLQQQFPNGRIPFPGPFGPGERPNRPERPDGDR